MNVVADLVATMSEHATWDGAEQRLSSASEHLLTKNSQVKEFSFFQKFYIFLSILVFVFFSLVFCRIAYACGFHTLLWKMCCRPMKKPRREDIELQPNSSQAAQITSRNLLGRGGM